MENTTSLKIPEVETCGICAVTYQGWGNNPAPFPTERCCEDCNRRYVIPARLVEMSGRKLTANEFNLIQTFASMARQFVNTRVA